MNDYPRAAKYPDLETVYAQCSGPGGLKLAEFLAEKLDIQPGNKLLDVGFNRGYQSCFLAKEYGCFVVGIDPWTDFFATIQETEEAVLSAGLEILEAAYAPDARLWWEEYVRYDPTSRQDPQGEAHTIAIDNGRWLSFGYVIAQKI